MENTLAQIALLSTRHHGRAGSRDVLLPMIATRDIGAVAAEALLRLDFRGRRRRSCWAEGHDLHRGGENCRRSDRETGPSLHELPDEQVIQAMTGWEFEGTWRC